MVPLFLGVGGAEGSGLAGGADLGGDAGSGLSMVEVLLLPPELPLVDGRSPVAKLTPESALLSTRRCASFSSSKYSGPATSRHSSMTPLEVRRYLSTASLTTVQPLTSSFR